VDGIAARQRVITFDNRVSAPPAVHADDDRADGERRRDLHRALGFDQVDLFGFSMGGMIAR